MSDSRVDKLTAHYIKETPHPEVVGVEELRKEAIWHIKDMEAAGLIVIDPDDADDAIERMEYVDDAADFPASVLELLTALRDAE